MKIISEKKREKIKDIYRKNREISKSEIARMCGVSRSFVHKLINELEKK